MIGRNACSQNGEGQGVKKDAFVPPQKADQQDEGEGIHENALIPAEGAGDKLQNLAKIQATQSGEQRCRQGDEDIGLLS